MSILKLLLVPLAMIYDLIMNLRNRMYDQNLKPSTSFDLPVIGVGNLAVGGTGKTPTVEYLIRLLSNQYKVVTLSRGYGRKTKGYIVASSDQSARTIGDEPLQLFLKYGDKINVTVCEDRAFAVPHIIDQFPDTNVIVMDDAFQHRRVKPGMQILITEFHRPFYDDHVLPYGRLREGPEGASRAHVIIVTKCPPNLDESVMMKMQHEFREYSSAPVFFTKIRYGEPRSFGNHGKDFSPRIVLVSGIANSKIIEQYVEKNFNMVKHFDFNDHHNYSDSDLRKIERFVGENGSDDLVILTTEKDMSKLKAAQFERYVNVLPFFSLPIEMEFIGSGKEFDTLILSFLNSFSGE